LCGDSRVLIEELLETLTNETSGVDIDKGNGAARTNFMMLP
jgi:hypothetical protein